MNGRLVSGVNNIVTEGGYIPVQFDFENTENLAAGTYADIYLVCQQADSCIALPKSAITEELGTKYVFVKVDDHGYQKRLVTTAGSDGERTVILSGVNPGEEVVTQGTVFVKLAQTKNVVPEGHFTQPLMKFRHAKQNNKNIIKQPYCRNCGSGIASSCRLHNAFTDGGRYFPRP